MNKLCRSLGIDCLIVGNLVSESRQRFLTWAQKAGHVVTVEESARQGGFGSAILEMLADNHAFQIKVKNVAIPDRFIEHGPQDELRRRIGLDSTGIVSAVKHLLQAG